MVGSVVAWLVTSSAFALLFAFLGPVIAIASVGDSAIHGRRRARRELSRYEAALDDLESGLAIAHDAERAALLTQYPTPAVITARDAHDPARWRPVVGEEIPVILGFGDIRSSTRIVGAVPHGDERARGLVERASVLARAPVIVDARLGIGVCGPGALAQVVARGILVQLAATLAPNEFTVATDGEPAWLDGLPHGRAAYPQRPGAVSFMGSHEVMVATAASRASLPPRCGVVVTVGADRSRITSHPDASHLGPVELLLVSEVQAGEWATLVGRAGERSGASLPASLAFGELPVPVAVTGCLSAMFAVGASGAVAVDLVADGPHAIIGGTTGSGKSELLTSWILSMAAVRGPAEVNFLLVDFKGGASFEPVRDLPHVVGLVTDLDERSARRALASLRAELRFREQVMADEAVRGIDELRPERLPRLVILVDEFAALASGFPELHDLFADIAARGRSLGVHLVLCTQRPAGVVRDAVLANAAIRISLRVNNAADSTAVIGTAAAATLSADHRGRALLAVAGEPPREVQVAISSRQDVAAVAARWSDAAPVRRPWRDELPSEIPLASLAPAPRGIPFGLLDRPEDQRQETAWFDPVTQGNLLVLGGHGSGKSTMLAALAADERASLLPRDIEGAWDELVERVAALRAGQADPCLLLVDDLDALLLRVADDYQQALLDLLGELMRTGSHAGVHVVVSARRLGGQLQAIAALCDSRVLLRMSDRQEHLLAGGESDRFDAAARPGRGSWQRAQVQVANPENQLGGAKRATVTTFDARGGAAVVSTRPAEFAVRLRGRGLAAIELAGAGAGPDLVVESGGMVIVASPEDWQSNWALLGRVRSAVPLVFEGCTPADLRSFGLGRALPPPLATPGAFWVLRLDGAVVRSVLG